MQADDVEGATGRRADYNRKLRSVGKGIQRALLPPRRNGVADIVRSGDFGVCPFPGAAGARDCGR